MDFTPIENSQFADLKRDIERRPRLGGYYIIEMVSLPSVPPDPRAADALLDQLFQHFDDQEWPAQSQRPDDQAWADYECCSEAAGCHVIDALVGGAEIGHTRVTMPQSTAADFWDRFTALFPEPRRFFTGMGLGDSQHVFQYGAAVVGAGAAGILWIVESD